MDTKHVPSSRILACSSALGLSRHTAFPRRTHAAVTNHLSAKWPRSLCHRPQINFICWPGVLVDSMSPAGTLGFQPLCNVSTSFAGPGVIATTQHILSSAGSL